MKIIKWKIVHVFILLPVLLSAQNVTGGLDCAAAGCHNPLINKEHIHPPAEEDCSSCHEANENEHPASEGNEFTLSADPSELCGMCHEVPQDEGTIHAPVEAGECSTCHSPHSSDYSSLLVSETTGEICSSCHDLDVEKPVSIHAPVKDQNCQNCHNPHQSSHGSLLKEEAPQLCFSCHEQKSKEMELDIVHPPFEECSNCHEVHQSGQKRLLVGNLPDLCFTCHSDLQENLSDSSFVHDPFLQEKSCASCHTPHAAANESLTISEQPHVCFSCHDRQITLEDRKVPNIKEKFSKRNTIHQAIDAGGCTVCHNPHYADNQKFFSESFPSGKYSSDYNSAYNLCFSCHDSEMLSAEEGDGETEFRAGKRNLHFLHVSRPKSRSCSTCHDPHGTRNNHLIAEKVQFGQWEMSLNYQIYDNGGSCRPGCHAEKKYGKEIQISTEEVKVSSEPKRIEIRSVSSTESENKADKPEEKREIINLRAESNFEAFQIKYNEALAEYEQKNYHTAIQYFEELLQIDSTNSLADNCQYWIGESYFGLKEYERAIEEFDKVPDFAESNKNDAALYKIGLCYQRLNLTGFAAEAFRQFIKKYPESEFIVLAKRNLAQIK